MNDKKGIYSFINSQIYNTCIHTATVTDIHMNIISLFSNTFRLLSLSSDFGTNFITECHMNKTKCVIFFLWIQMVVDVFHWITSSKWKGSSCLGIISNRSFDTIYIFLFSLWCSENSQSKKNTQIKVLLDKEIWKLIG